MGGPSALAGDFEDAVYVDGLGVAEGVGEGLSGSRICIVFQVRHSLELFEGFSTGGLIYVM